MPAVEAWTSTVAPCELIGKRVTGLNVSTELGLGAAQPCQQAPQPPRHSLSTITRAGRHQSQPFHSALRRGLSNTDPVPVTAHQSWQTAGFVLVSISPRAWELLGEQRQHPEMYHRISLASHVAFNKKFTPHEMNGMIAGPLPWLHSACLPSLSRR